MKQKEKNKSDHLEHLNLVEQQNANFTYCGMLDMKKGSKRSQGPQEYDNKESIKLNITI